MGEPEALIAALEKTGNTVYPVHNIQNLIQSGQADSIRPAAVINLAHGRLGDYIVDYLSRQNIPLFAPLNTNRLVEEWEADKMGMNGGFLSQSVVMPEIDGAIRPFALFGHRLDDEGCNRSTPFPNAWPRSYKPSTTTLPCRASPTARSASPSTIIKVRGRTH